MSNESVLAIKVMEKKEMSETEKFAINLKRRMDRVRITPARLAQLSGLPRSTISRVLKAQRTPGLETLSVLANALGTTSSALLDSKTRLAALTGIKEIDAAIELIQWALHEGASGLRRCKHLFHPDYRLHYSDIEIGNPDRLGPTLEEEIAINSENLRNIKIKIKSACIFGQTVINQLLLRHDGVPRNTSIPRAIPEPVVVAELLDGWLLTKSVEEIAAGEKFQIRKRWIKVLYEGQE
ncbi:MAG: helix-turn-helix domain-containing protein [Candidatus Latescibacterota bacterium]|nr:helix-turn-helix domain-containing protein [Candidatus Latescibacterota bacterium]